jgi:hypothetical protein
LKRTIYLAPFFTMMVRYPFAAACFYLSTGHFIPWVESKSSL